MLVKRNLISIHLEIVLVSVQDRCTVCTECNTGVEIALGTPGWYSKVMYVKWKLVLVRFEILLVLAQDRCTVCAKCTSGMEIILGTPDGTPRCRDSCGGSVSFGAR